MKFHLGSTVGPFVGAVPNLFSLRGVVRNIFTEDLWNIPQKLTQRICLLTRLEPFPDPLQTTNLQRLKNRVHFHWIPSVHYWMSASSWFPTHSLTSNEEETIDYFPKSGFKTLSKASNPSFRYRANTLENLLDFLLFCWKGSSYLVAWNREMYFCSLAYKDQLLELGLLNNTSFGRLCIYLSQIWCIF